MSLVPWLLCSILPQSTFKYAWQVPLIVQENNETTLFQIQMLQKQIKTSGTWSFSLNTSLKLINHWTLQFSLTYFARLNKSKSYFSSFALCWNQICNKSWLSSIAARWTHSTLHAKKLQPNNKKCWISLSFQVCKGMRLSIQFINSLSSIWILKKNTEVSSDKSMVTKRS